MKKILLSTPFLAGEELVCFILNRLARMRPSYSNFPAEIIDKADGDWFVDDHFTVGRFIPAGEVSERLLAEEVLPVFLVRNVYDLLIDQHRYFSEENSVFWCDYLSKMSKNEGVSTLITGSMSSGFRLFGLDICCRQMQEMLQFSAHHRCCVISYEKLLHNPDEQIKILADLLEIKLTEEMRDEIKNGLAREIEAITGRNVKSNAKFRYGLSCEFNKMLTDVHLDMIENILAKHAPDLGLLSFTHGFPEVTAQSETLIDIRRKRIFVATIFKSGTKLIEYIVSNLTKLSEYKFEEESGSDYESADLISFERGNFFIWHSFPSNDVKAKIRAEGAKPIFLIRNIYDLLVSQYFHFADDVDASIGRSTLATQYFETMRCDEGISLIICGATSEFFHWHGFEYSLRQIQEMLLFSKEYPCHIIVYDRLVLNRKQEIERLAKFLDIDVDSNLMNVLLFHSSLEQMRESRIEIFGSGKHFRKGTPGDHVNVLKPYHYHMINHIKMTHAPLLDRLCEELGLGDVTAPVLGGSAVNAVDSDAKCASSTKTINR
jgi:hypothetical protein